ncbi:MAG: hypothetical protein A3J74_08495 [Elusimicrobia bacterium RIFCSPHIGHO2_02_FULL_57_9]|nr:MAG: hypothetical protein A3J74_08495 [Elusimicrobia bacterium RIFCSPHIGHO2_02_FULL_57_9]
MEAIESEGKNVAEAVDNALKKLNLRRDQVEVQILQEAGAGFMGFGAKPARVRISEKLWGIKSGACALDARAACAQSVEKLKEVLSLMAIGNPSLSADWDKGLERVKIRVESADAEILIGPEGKTLQSLQFLLTLILSRRLGSPVAVQVDAKGHWEKMEKDILSEAQRAVEEVKTTGKPFRLSPMEAPMRRLVHKTLAGHPDVETASEGEGSWRKIVIRPKRR